MGDQKRWIDHYSEAGTFERLGLLGGAAVRFSANAIDRVASRAARTIVEAEHAFRKEIDPNISDARVLEETTQKPPQND
ncbi:hypothetical protein BH23BAC4_BH23BAC4_07860 [soil metagenome]